MSGKLLILCGPSGSGKTTIVKHLLATFPSLSFSVSATTRQKREGETNGKDYHFITADAFRELVKEDAFIEHEEVYHGLFYGTLKQEITRLWAADKAVVFDVDVVGALNLKKQFPTHSLAIIVVPPSLVALEERLKNRQTESDESLERRLGKAEEEMKLAILFDKILVNADLEDALAEAESVVGAFLLREHNQ